MDRQNIGAIAYRQGQDCTAPPIGIFASAAIMSEFDADIQLVRDLVSWTGHTVAQIAREIEVANTTLNRFNKGNPTSRLSFSTVEKLKARYPEFPAWRSDEGVRAGRDERQYVSVPVLPSYAGAGGGGSGDGERETALLPRYLIEDELRGHASDFELIDVRGDSMTPDFQHGDQILVDKRDRDPRQPGPFALWDDDGYVLKLVERVPQRRGWYRIFSANDRYSPYEVEETETTILGRPVWFARRL